MQSLLEWISNPQNAKKWIPAITVICFVYNRQISDLIYRICNIIFKPFEQLWKIFSANKELVDSLKNPAKRLDNISVYYVTEIVKGNTVTRPLGVIPKFNKEYEDFVKYRHAPDEHEYINEDIGNTSVILYWYNNGIEAICFFSEKEAQRFPGFIAFSKDDLVIIQQGLKHFPHSTNN